VGEVRLLPIKGSVISEFKDSKIEGDKLGQTSLTSRCGLLYLSGALLVYAVLKLESALHLLPSTLILPADRALPSTPVEYAGFSPIALVAHQVSSCFIRRGSVNPSQAICL
jgi:hypothetical protein